MKVAGEAVLPAPREKVWEALHDPNVLVRTIPGVERLETTGDNTYAMTVTAGVAAVRGTYSGTCELQDVEAPGSLVLKASGSGAPGTIAADVQVALQDTGDGSTFLKYDADATVGGMIGGVGQRMLTSVSKRMAAEFFSNVENVLSGVVPAPAEAAPAAAAAPAEAGAAPRPGEVFAAPARPVAAAAGGDFLKGVLVGGGLVLAGVVAGALAARRRG